MSIQWAPMLALLHDPGAPHGLRLGDAPDPVPNANQALVAIDAISLNFGELAFIDGDTPVGAIRGWDAAGTVIDAAADGSGPPRGTRVVTFAWSGAWAQRRAVDTAELAALPDNVDSGDAAALPVAGVAALRALRRLGSVVLKRVLITGASGGVGRFAVQLAAIAGAEVVALSRRTDGLRELGATEVVDSLDGLAPVNFVLDTVGGPLLAEAVGCLDRDGLAVNIGMSSLEPTTLNMEEVRHKSRATIEAFVVGTGFAHDLALLVRLVAHGELDPQVGWRGSWEQVHEAATALLSREVQGKAILTVSSGS